MGDMKSAEGSARLGSKRSKKWCQKAVQLSQTWVYYMDIIWILYGYYMDYMVYLKMANLLGEMAKR